MWFLLTALGAGCSLFVDTDDFTSGPVAPPADAATVPADVVVAEARAPDADASAPTVQRPLEGTYSYLASGNDFLSLGDQYATWGPAALATVVHRDADCFTLSFQYRDRFTEELDFCAPRGEQLVHSTSRRTQSFRLFTDFVTARTTTTCTPGDVFLVPSPATDTTLTHVCKGENDDDQNGASSFQTGGPYRFLGTEDVLVSTTTARAHHFREERAVTGAQVGKATTDWYFSVERALPVKVTKDTSIKFVAVNIDYREKSELTLASLAPTPFPDAGAKDAAKD